MKTPSYVRRAKNNYNAKFDLIQARLPKGTKDRIKNLGIGQNEFACESILKHLEELENEQN